MSVISILPSTINITNRVMGRLPDVISILPSTINMSIIRSYHLSYDISILPSTINMDFQAIETIRFPHFNST